MIRRRVDNGQAAVVAVLAMPVILGMVGLAIDVGYLRAVKRQMQGKIRCTRGGWR